MLSDYDEYRGGFQHELYDVREDYPKSLEGISYSFLCKNESIVSGFKDNTTLHFVNIYFASPTFEKFTHDEKANFEARLSSIGGTVGFFAGVSIISVAEVIYFSFKLMFCKLFCQTQSRRRRIISF